MHRPFRHDRDRRDPRMRGRHDRVRHDRVLQQERRVRQDEVNRGEVRRDVEHRDVRHRAGPGGLHDAHRRAAVHRRDADAPCPAWMRTGCFPDAAVRDVPWGEG